MKMADNSGSKSGMSQAGNQWDAIIAYGVCAIILVVLVLFAFNFSPSAPSSRWLTLLAGTGGSAAGWATGIIVSPYDPAEEQQFRSLAKAVYAFATGYALAKLDPLLTQAIDSAKGAGVSIQTVTNISVALIAFLTVATATYVSRKYWP